MAEMKKSAVEQAELLEQKESQKQAPVDVTKMLSAIRTFLPDAANLDPASKAKKNIFLTEKRYEAKREALKNDIKGWLSLLDNEELTSATEFSDYCKDQEEKYTELLQKGVTTALDVTQNLERTYRALDAFFKNAGTDKVNNLRIVNVNKDDIADDDSGFREEIDALLKEGYDQLSLKDSYSLMCIPGAVFEDRVSLLQWAKVAHKYKVMLVTDHADEDCFDDIKANTEGFKDSDIELMNVVMTANWIEGREAEKYSELEQEAGAFYVYPSGALAGKLYNENVTMAQGAAGKKFGTLDGVKGVHAKLLKSEIASLMDNQVVPMVLSEGRVMAFNNMTLYNGDLTDMKEYPIVRVFDWVKKVLMNFANEKVHEVWDKFRSPKELKERIQDFLNQHKGYGKLFQDYQIGEPQFDKESGTVTCDISLTPFNAARNFLIKVSADKSSKDATVEVKD